MSNVLDNYDIGRLMNAIQTACFATFDVGDWQAIATQTETQDWLRSHPRLLRGATYKDNEDYPGLVSGAVSRIFNKGIEYWRLFLEYPKVKDWLYQNAAPLMAELFGSEPVPPFADHAKVIHEFLYATPALSKTTKGFKELKHDSMLEIIRAKAGSLPGKPTATIFQSLQDSGCDLLIQWGGGAKYGVQLKSYFDISQDDFTEKTIVQIADSRAYGLLRLYVLFAGDLTNKSHPQKLRMFEARIQRMNDPYVVTVSPERVWNLLHA